MSRELRKERVDTQTFSITTGVPAFTLCVFRQPSLSTGKVSAFSFPTLLGRGKREGIGKKGDQGKSCKEKERERGEK